jgi:type IV pilus assembly protein PilM
MTGLSLKMPGWLTLPAWTPGTGAGNGLLAPLLEPRYPSVAFDIDTRSLAMVRLGRRKKERFIAAFDVVDLPPDLIELDFYRVKLTAPDRFRSLVEKLIEKDSVKIHRVSLLLPDNYARVAILPFDGLPKRRRDALELVRWKTKKAVPFKVEEAAVDYMVLPGAGHGVTVLAVLTPRSVMEEFEGVFTSLGIHPGLVDLSTLSLLNFYRPVLERESENGSECLLANISGGFMTFVIFRGRQMVLFRSKPFAAGVPDDGGEGALRLLKRELQTSLLYYREKLEGRQLSRAYLRILDLDGAAVSRIFSDQPEIEEVAVLDPRRIMDLDGRLTGEQGDRMLQRLAPALGATLGRSAR